MYYFLVIVGPRAVDQNGAREGNRTLVSSLEGLCSTTELLSRDEGILSISCLTGF